MFLCLFIFSKFSTSVNIPSLPVFKLNLNKTTGADVIKHFIVVIYHHSLVITSFCVTKLYYPGNYYGKTVNCHSKKFYNIGP